MKFASLGTFSGLRQTTCSDCAPGYYNTKNGSSQCIQCPPGHSCSDASLNPFPCEQGTAAGHHGSVSCPPCGNGNYSDTTGKTACDICPAGSECSNPAISPVKCEIGKFSEAGKVSCTTCPIGHVTTVTGSTFCIICGAGKDTFFEIFVFN